MRIAWFPEETTNFAGCKSGTFVGVVFGGVGVFRGLLQSFSAGARRRQTKRTKTKPFAACFRSEGHETQRNPAGAFGWLPGAPRARLYRDLPWAGVPWVLFCRATFYRAFH